MHSRILLAMAILLTSQLRAQITVTSADMPSVGDTVRRSITLDFTGIVPETTGAGHTWDYSTLVADSQTVDTFASVLSTGLYALNFVGASFAQKSNTAPLSLGVVTVDYKYDFFGKNASGYTHWGVGAEVTGLPLGLVNSPRDTLYRFPLDYLDTSNATAEFAITVPGLGYFGGVRNRVDTVDGWGTLITPYGSFSVLRVKSVVNEIDTVFVTSLGFGLLLPLPERIEYKWLANGMDIPLLQIGTSLGNVTDVTYRDSLRIILTGLQNPAALENSIQIYPVPVKDRLTMKHSTAVNRIEIWNVQGQKMLSMDTGNSSNAHELSIATLAPGIYLFKAFTLNGAIIRKFIKY